MANIAIDYTSRDFQSIKADLIKVIQNRLAQSPEGKVWDATDSSDFALALVEAFAYVGDITNYYIDRIANEAYLPTAVQRSSILKLAKSLNYQPSGFTQATVVVTASNSQAQDAVIPAGTELSVTVPSGNKSTTRIMFTTAEEVTVPAKSAGVAGTADVTLYCGEDVSLRSENKAVSATELDGEYLTTSSSGYANQSYNLKVGNPVESSIQIYVEENQKYILWTQVDHLYDYGPQATVYSVTINADNSATISFGDGVSGVIPVQGAEIKAQYSVLAEGGTLGNVPAGLKDWKVVAVPSNLDVAVADLAHLTFSNSEAGYGGTNPESNDSIRLNAPKALTTLNRAVSLVDYANLSVGVPGVGAGKAASYADSPRSVVVYVGPEKDVGQQGWYPGYNDSNTEVRDSLVDLTNSVEKFLEDRSLVGTSITVLPPEYVDVNIYVLYKRPEELSDSVVQSSIKTALFNAYGYDAMTFDKRIWPDAVEAELKANSSASRISVRYLYKDSISARETPTRDTLVANEGELFIFSDALRDAETNLYGLQMFPFASLLNLTFSAGTVNKVFNSAVYSYGVKLPHGTSSLTLTPTKIISSDVVTYTLNGKPHSTGVFTSIPVNKKQTIGVVVTSEDGSNSTTYTISVVRAKA